MDETENNPSESPELSPTPATPESEEPSTDQPEGESEQEELEEIEYEDVKVALRKDAAQKLRDALMRQADYTRKTQELAQQRQQSDAEIAAEKQRIQMERANIQAIARLTAVDDQLKQLTDVDIDALYDRDPVQAGKLQARMQQLSMQRQQIVAQVQQHEQQRAMQEQQATAKRLQEAEAVLKREIKGWSSEHAKRLGETARALGATDAELQSITAPWIVRALHAQHVLSQMTAKAKAPEPVAPAQPIRTVTGGKAPAAVDPMKLPMDEWVKHEQKRLAKLGRRY